MKNFEEIRNELGYKGHPINGCHYLDSHFRTKLDQRCLLYEGIDQNYQEFMSEVGAWIDVFNKEGITKGDRVIMLLPLRIELYQIMCALFYVGAVVVSIDSTMPKDKLKMALKDANAQAIFSVRELLRWTPFLPALWKTKRFTIGPKSLFSKDLLSIKGKGHTNFKQVEIASDAPALISFTSGSTGRPKAANRSLDIFLAQKIVSEYYWQHSPDEVDMPFFPTLVLQNLGVGISTVFPNVNFRDIRNFDPAVVVAQMKEHKVTRFSATPMIIQKIANYVAMNGIKIESLRSIIIGGAELSVKNAKLIREAFKSTEIHIIYGSTEVEPISHVSLDDYIANEEIGLCLGETIDVLGIKIKALENCFDFNSGVEWGEIILSGPHVIKEYIDNHPANLTTKHKDEEGRTWHSTGDVGYLKNGKVYLLGRIKDCLQVGGKLIPTFHLENQLNLVTGVKRAAVVQKDNSILCLIEKSAKQLNSEQVKELLKASGIQNYSLVMGEVPVDNRHFSRVERSKIRAMI